MWGEKPHRVRSEEEIQADRDDAAMTAEERLASWAPGGAEFEAAVLYQEARRAKIAEIEKMLLTPRDVQRRGWWRRR